MKTFIKILSSAALIAGLASHAQAGTQYYLYQKAGTSECDISTKHPDAYNRGSKWEHIATDSTRSGVKKQGESKGCTSF